MHLFGLVRRRRFPRADGPNRFIGDDDSGDIFFFEASDRFVTLRLDHIKMFLRVPRREGFPDTDDRNEAVFQSRLHFFVDQDIILLKILAAFGVAKNDIAATGILEHGRRDLARERAFRSAIHVLCAEVDRCIVQDLGNFAERGKRRADHDRDIRNRVRGRFERLHERDGLGGRLIHFPVPCDQRSLFHEVSSFLSRVYLSRSAATPGSTLPSTSSSDAPPPVEM